MSEAKPTKDYRIAAVRAFLIAPHNELNGSRPGEWLYDINLSNPMSKYPTYRRDPRSWGMDDVGSFYVEIEASDGTRGFAIGDGGLIGCFLIEHHFKRFLIDSDPRDIHKIWDQIYRGSLHYGRRGIAIMALSVIDLALWDLLGKIRGEPVYKLIGGQTRDHLVAYLTGPDASLAREQGFWGGKLSLPYGPGEPGSLQKNYDMLSAHRRKAGPDYPIMVDCYMSLNVSYAAKLIAKCADLNIEWWEEILSPDDAEGYVQLRHAFPQVKLTTGEHENTRFGFRKLIEGRFIDVVQPDIMWCGGLTELIRIATHAAAYDIDVIPHATSLYSVHFCLSQPNCPMIEYVAYSPDGKGVGPVYGDFFIQEPLPKEGIVRPEDFSAPGFGLEISPHVKLIPAQDLFEPYYRASSSKL